MRYPSVTRLVFTLVLLLSLVLSASCQEDTTPKTTISALTVVPVRVATYQPVNIGANVLNSGKKSELYSAVLKINDAVIETKQITVGAGETQTISFQYVPTTTGNFRVEINAQIGGFEVVKPAAFSAESLAVSPASPAPGAEATASIKVQNTGDLSGPYTVVLKVDGKEIKSDNVTLEAGVSRTVALSFSLDSAGKHTVEMGGMSQVISVLKPSDFKGGAVTVSPSSVLPGESVTIEASVSNDGEVKDTREIALMVNGTASGSQALTLEGGATGKVTFTYSSETSGAYDVSVMGLTGSFTVLGLSKYSSESFFYSVLYPPDLKVDDEEAGNVLIENSGGEGITVDVERLSTETTAKEYFDQVIEDNQDALSEWKVISQSEIVQDGAVIGYKYDSSYFKIGKKYLGKGAVTKKAGFGYNVDFHVAETSWPKYKVAAAKSVDSFTSPRSFTGAYSNTTFGIALTLPPEWSATETGKANSPILITTPYFQNEIVVFLVMDSVAAGITAKQVVDASLQAFEARGWTVSSGSSFTFADGTQGYQRPLSGIVTDGTTFIFRTYGQVKEGRAIMLLFYGPASDINQEDAAIAQLARSLVVSKGGGVEGVDRKDAIFFPEGEIVTLDPALVETGPGDIVGAVFSGLVRIDTNLEVVSDLAETWTLSPDGKVYTFNLRKNAKFHDGRAVTAADVKYSWERACDPLLKSPKAKTFLADITGAKDRLNGSAAGISGIKVISDYVLEVTLDEARPYFLGEICQPVAFVVDKADIGRGSDWYEQPNGTGPFKLKSWTKDSLLVLERNDSFYMTPAKVKNLVFRLYAGNPMALYENGEIDITPVGTADQDKVLDTANSLSKEVVKGSVYNMDYVGLNVTKPPFDDVKIRQALAAALDIPKLIEVSLKGRAEISAGYIPPGIPGNNPALQPIAFNLEKAKQLIKESKYQSPENVPAITMYALYGVTPVQQAMIGMWQALGLKVNTQVVSTYEDFLARIDRKEFQLWTSGWRADYIDPQNFLEVLFQSQSPENHFGYSNPEVDAALAKAAVELDPAKRLKMYQDIENMILKDLPGIPLWCKTKSYVLVKPYVKGYAVYPMDINIWRELSVTPH